MTAFIVRAGRFSRRIDPNLSVPALLTVLVLTGVAPTSSYA
jgi:hypothetical protein